MKTTIVWQLATAAALVSGCSFSQEAPVASSTLTADRLVQIAKTYEQQGRTEKAVSMYKQATTGYQDPKSVQIAQQSIERLLATPPSPEAPTTRVESQKLLAANSSFEEAKPLAQVLTDQKSPREQTSTVLPAPDSQLTEWNDPAFAVSKYSPTALKPVNEPFTLLQTAHAANSLPTSTPEAAPQTSPINNTPAAVQTRPVTEWRKLRPEVSKYRNENTKPSLPSDAVIRGADPGLDGAPGIISLDQDSLKCLESTEEASSFPGVALIDSL